MSSHLYDLRPPLDFQHITSDMDMVKVLVLFLATIFLAASLGESWLPSRFVKFRQPLHNRRNQRQYAQIMNMEDQADASQKEEGQLEEEEDDARVAEQQKHLSLLPWWEDSWSEAFMNSFPLSPLSSSASSTVSTADLDETDLLNFESYRPNPNAQVLHFCFLLHGHRGFAADLSYLQRAMQHHAELGKRAQYGDDDNNKNDDSSAVAQHDMIVHCAVCNAGKTMDGVINGGERLVQEILQVIRRELDQRRSLKEECDGDDSDKIQDITISVVGNSLGGIYGRYAIAMLAQKAADKDKENHPDLIPATNNSTASSNTIDDNKSSTEECPSCVLLDGKHRLHFNIFCTTASPHLGISKHTYVPVPRSVEIGAAHVLGETGKDLFRLNGLMKTMSTSPTYLEPLRKFRKRVAYANAYATDFPVPASTAAFLSDESTYPHHFDEGSSSNLEQDNPYIVATLHTQQAKQLPTNPTLEQEAVVDDLVQMSNSLDSLGWKKVFVDIRKEIPLQVTLPTSSLHILESLTKTSLLLTPKILQRSGSGLSQKSTESEDAPDVLLSPTLSSDDEDDNLNSNAAPSVSAIHRLQQKGVVESRDVASVVTTPEDMKLSVPLGHNLMVALARSGISGDLYKGGRPVMDSLAKELVQGIFDWKFQEEHDVIQDTTLIESTNRRFQ